MEQTYPVVEFETTLGDDGTIVVPSAMAEALRSRDVVVRVVAGRLGGSLRKRGVTEDEVERIALLQMEQRENVLSFLSAEGALAASAPFSRRSAQLLKKKT